MALSTEMFLKQIFPFRVGAANQIQLFLARAAFDLLLAGNGYVNVIPAFEEYQFRDIVLLCEGSFAFTMLQHPAPQVVGHAGVEYGMVGIGHDVNAVLSVTHFHSQCHCEEGVLCPTKQSPVTNVLLAHNSTAERGDCFASLAMTLPIARSDTIPTAPYL